MCFFRFSMCGVRVYVRMWTIIISGSIWAFHFAHSSYFVPHLVFFFCGFISHKSLRQHLFDMCAVARPAPNVRVVNAEMHFDDVDRYFSELFLEIGCERSNICGMKMRDGWWWWDSENRWFCLFSLLVDYTLLSFVSCFGIYFSSLFFFPGKTASPPKRQINILISDAWFDESFNKNITAVIQSLNDKTKQ